MIIQVIGAQGSGKTTLASALADKLNAVYLQAGSEDDTTGRYARVFEELGEKVVVDFNPPTQLARDKMGKPTIIVWLNTEEDLGEFEAPEHYDYCFESNLEDPEEKVNLIIEEFNLL